MADELILDFSDAPPAQGGGRYDYVPAGTYVLEVGKSVIGESQKGKPMITVPFVVAQGQHKGRRLGSFFTIARTGTDDHKFPLQRLHALVMACGFKKLDKSVPAGGLMSKMEGKKCVVEIEDRVLPATDKRSETTVSDLVAFYSAKSEEGQAFLKAQQDGTKAEASAEEPAVGAEPEEVPAAEETATPEASVDPDNLDSLFEE